MDKSNLKNNMIKWAIGGGNFSFILYSFLQIVGIRYNKALCL